MGSTIIWYSSHRLERAHAITITTTTEWLHVYCVQYDLIARGFSHDKMTRRSVLFSHFEIRTSSRTEEARVRHSHWRICAKPVNVYQHQYLNQLMSWSNYHESALTMFCKKWEGVHSKFACACQLSTGYAFTYIYLSDLVCWLCSLCYQ